ncbi:CPBP family intramembrane metalloprotease [Marinicauda algicola]|uniref:CPBP family intramembrane metalloprotease n=1 Tax=Marinicauda algicola TaxID=2029849 RepID=A0A4S2GZE8_9PROT|nr:type II CAAX endopeptidase family protein [Marinicauda algicola]TGY88585.1 CPBP family intramembrane metalloprotease [Marinicauda algicola]
MKTALYAPWPEAARRSWGWAALLLVVLFYLAGALLYGVGQLVWIVATRGAGVFADEAALEAALATLPPAGVLFALLLVQFLVWGGLAWLWLRAFERRGVASIGMGPRQAGRRFFGGLFLSAAVLAALAVAVALMGVVFPVDIAGEVAAADWGRLADPGVWLVFGAIALFFLLQGGIEEVVFRGWLMSTLAARWGRTAGVIATTLAFTLLHAHVLLAGLANGLAGLAGIFMTGLFLALLALRQGSIWGVIGLHGGFNALTLISTLAVALARSPETPLGVLIVETFQRATGLEAGAGFQPQALAQALVFALFSAVLIWRMPARR